MRTMSCDMSENNHGSGTGNHSVYSSEVRVHNDKKCKQNRSDRNTGPQLILEDTAGHCVFLADIEP